MDIGPALSKNSGLVSVHHVVDSHQLLRAFSLHENNCWINTVDKLQVLNVHLLNFLSALLMDKDWQVESCKSSEVYYFNPVTGEFRVPCADCIIKLEKDENIIVSISS